MTAVVTVVKEVYQPTDITSAYTKFIITAQLQIQPQSLIMCRMDTALEMLQNGQCYGIMTPLFDGMHSGMHAKHWLVSFCHALSLHSSSLWSS